MMLSIGFVSFCYNFKNFARIYVTEILIFFPETVSPTLVRQIRAQLNENAENESINVFVANLRQLLMTRPLRGKVVMAIDPGFKNGCKVALVDQHGTVQHVDKFFLPQMSKSSSSNSVKLRELLNTFWSVYNSSKLLMPEASIVIITFF